MLPEKVISNALSNLGKNPVKIQSASEGFYDLANFEVFSAEVYKFWS